MSIFFDDMVSFFNEQRRAVPKAYECRNQIVKLTKDGMIKILHKEDVNIICRELIELWSKLGSLSLPLPTANQFDSDSGQEIVEFYFVKFFFCVVTDTVSHSVTDEIINDFQLSISGLNVPQQIVLRGLVDGVTELSRMLSKFISENNLTRKDRIIMRRNYISIAEDMNSFFEKIEMDTIPTVVDSYNNRGFRNSFRSILNRVRSTIEYQYRLLETEIVMSPDNS